MDCLKAQQLVSAALDHETQDPGDLAIAKEHCRTCPECAAFVSALVAIQRAVLPEPPSDLADRIIAAVDAERARAERTAAAIAATQRMPASSSDSAVVGREAAPSSVISLRERLVHPRYRRAVIAWSSAAAVALVAAGIGAVYGARVILTDKTASQVTILSTGEKAAEDVGGVFGNATGTAAATAPNGTEMATTQSYGDAAAANLIVVDGAVYKSAGPDSSVTKDSLTVRGSTRAALEAGTSPTDRTVLGTGDPARVFIEADDGSILAFDRVTMSYEGRTYVLQSGPLGQSGLTALPQGMVEPITASGSPTFEAVDANASPPIFVMSGKDATTGIALPPGARSDLSEGWTWWLPTAQ